ncbi:response regulator transcription factor [Pseudomonas sp. LRF_L74]|uniref:response regulator transcription factor n=1 Tax=Pseudomonas sp. LRF_L74 TaxID=3369422 RepID=UPI003F5DBD77
MERLKKGVKLLIVDDDHAALQELCEYLDDSDFICLPCQQPREAIELFQADHEIGLVLCDLDMPQMDGIALVRELERIAGDDHPFESILLTGKGQASDVVDAMRVGIADYYQKPVDMTLLLLALQRLELKLRDRLEHYNMLEALNQKLHFVATSVDELYREFSHAKRSSGKTEPTTLKEQQPVVLPAYFEALSPRQLDVARLVCKGMTNYQIACELGITENTVKLYVSQVLRLTHMHNRTQLALALSPGKSGRATTH